MRYSILFHTSLMLFFFFTACGRDTVHTPSEPPPSNNGSKQQASKNGDSPTEIPQGDLPFPGYSQQYLSSQDLESLLQKWGEVGEKHISYDTFAKGTASAFPFLRAKFQEEKQDLPKVLITASTHGDEQISTAALLGVMERLFQSVSLPIQPTHPLYNREIFFAPAVCYSGYKAQSREVNGIDPNRNYPSPITPQRQAVGCTKASMDFFAQHSFKAILDIHAYGRMVLLPWAYSDAPLQGQKSIIFSSVAKAMAEEKNYSWGQVPVLLYTAEGSSMDYYVWQGELQNSDVLALALEISDSKKPPESEIPSVVNELYPLVTQFLKLAPEALVKDGFSNSLFLSQNSFPLTQDEYYISDISLFPLEE